VSAEGRQLRSFVAKLIAIRKTHSALRARHFFHGLSQLAPGVSDIAWFDAQGAAIPDEAWRNPEERLLSLRRAEKNDDDSISLLSLLLNPTGEDSIFRLPEPALPGRVLIDTANPGAAEISLKDHSLGVAAHSAVLVHSVLEGRSQ
jgi:glycogen operon protein